MNNVPCGRFAARIRLRSSFLRDRQESIFILLIFERECKYTGNKRKHGLNLLHPFGGTGGPEAEEHDLGLESSCLEIAGAYRIIKKEKRQACGILFRRRKKDAEASTVHIHFSPGNSNLHHGKPSDPRTRQKLLET